MEEAQSAAGAGAAKAERTVVESGMEVGIEPQTHKLVYRNGREDVMWRWRAGDEEGDVAARVAAKSEERLRRGGAWLARQGAVA